ncbi:MAG: hypothetical protein R6V76_02090 [Desulfobacterales bacterium]
MIKNEVDKTLENISGTHLLIAKLFYGCGLRLMECASEQLTDI